MRNGELTKVQLKNYTERRGITFYNFEITLNSKKIQLSERYSKLCKIAQRLPKNIKFPPKISLFGLKNLLFNKEAFIFQRFSQLKQYFENENIIKELQNSQLFIEKLEQLEFKQIKETKICKLHGMKLKSKQINVQNQYVVI